MKVEWFAEPFQLAQKQSDDVTSPEVWESDSEGDVRSSLMSPDSAAEKGSLLLIFNTIYLPIRNYTSITSVFILSVL